MKSILKFTLLALAFIFLTVTSCQKDDVADNEIIEKAAKVKPERTKPTRGEPKEGNEVGDLNHGGIIFWVSADGTHGLVGALEDITVDNELKGKKRVITRSWPWGCNGTLIPGEFGGEIGDGEQNTEDIVTKGCDVAGTAAHLCFNLSLNGYDDWFLPSYDELMEMYIELKQKTSYGNFSTGKYWSSTQLDANYARGIDFAFGSDFLDVNEPELRTKSSTRGVRPVRRFDIQAE